jgi:ParB family transcriptional regulator, chromosome partitioning protein
MHRSYYRDNVGEIRRQLASFSYRANDPRALLVGREAYLAAGGRLDPDLFATAESQAWLDTHIVDRLVEEKLAEAAAAVRDRDGFAEVRIVSATHVPYSETSDLRPLRGESVPLTEAEAARQAEIEEAISAIECETGDEDLTEEDENRVQILEAELSALTDRVPIVSDEQRAQAVAYVVIGSDGQPRLHEQLYIAPEQESSLDDDEDGDGAGEEDGATEQRKSGISQRLADELAMMKTELLAVHVANDPAFALDLGTFIMVEAASRTMGTWSIPSDLRANAPTPRVSGFESGTHAAAQWTAFDEGLDRSWHEQETIEARYDAFCSIPEEARAAWLGWAVARTLHAVPAGAAGSSFIDHLGEKLDIDVAAWWRPTARTYFDRITKPSILDLFAEVGGAELRTRYGASKKHDLAASAERLFAGDIIVEADVKERALRWLPPQMQFASQAGQDPEDGVEPSKPDDDVGDSAAPPAEAAPSDSASTPGDLADGA